MVALIVAIAKSFRNLCVKTDRSRGEDDHVPAFVRDDSASSDGNGSGVMTSTSPPTALGKPAKKSVQYKNLEEEHHASPIPSYRAVQYRVYPWRWFMLLTLCFLNVSNGMVRPQETWLCLLSEAATIYIIL